MLRTTEQCSSAACAVLAAVTIAACHLPGPGGAGVKSQHLLIEHATVIAMDRPEPLLDHAILVAGDSIVAVRPSGSMRVPPGTRRIDAAGRFVMPGLADLHVHLYDAQGLPSYLAHGVTTVADLNGSPRVLQWRRQVAAGEIAGPSIIASGPTINGYPVGNPLFVGALSGEDARALVLEQAAAGYDLVKIYSFLAPDVYAALMEQARSSRIPVVGHIPLRVGLDSVLGSGQANIAHMEEFFQAGPVAPDSYAALAVRVRNSGITVTPNLSAYADYLRNIDSLPAVLADREIRYVSPAAFAEKLPTNNRSVRPDPQQFAAFLRQRLQEFRNLTRAFSAAGVPLLLGTDTEIFGFAGHSAHVELLELVRSGLTPYQALRAATAAPGEFLSRQLPSRRPSGVLRAGMRADLVLLRKNPLDDVAHARLIDGVVAAGRWYPAERLAAIRDSVARGHEEGRAVAVAVDSLVLAGNGREAARRIAAYHEAHPGVPPVGELVLRNYARRLFQQDRAGSMALRSLAVSMYPTSVSSHNELARGLLFSGDTAQALANFRRALALSPGNFVVRDMLEKLTAAGEAPGVRPAEYKLLATGMRIDGVVRDAHVTLAISDSAGRPRGWFRVDGSGPIPADDLVVGAGRVWAAGSFAKEYLELRVGVDGESLDGTWVLGFVNSGRLSGIR